MTGTQWIGLRLVAPFTFLLHEPRAMCRAHVPELLTVLPNTRTPAQEPDASGNPFLNRPAALDDAISVPPSHTHGAATRPNSGFDSASVPSGAEHIGLPGEEVRKTVERAGVGHVSPTKRFDQLAFPLPMHLVLHPMVHLLHVSRKQRLPE